MRTFILFVAVIFFFSCKEQATGEDFVLNVRLTKDPGYLNPFYSPQSVSREVYQYIFLPAADFHPESLELHPILLEKIPEPQDTFINGKEMVYYDLDFKDDIQWSDGNPLTAKDYMFTMLMIKHPQSKIMAWKPYFQALRLVENDAKDLTRVRVYYDADYMLSREAAVTSYIMPSHVFDPDNHLVSKAKKIIEEAESYKTDDSLEMRIVEQTNSSVNLKEDIVQLGPYELREFETDAYVILDAKDNYWGSNYSDNVFLQQNPDRLIFRVVPDEISALNMAGEQKLDVLSLRSSQRFIELKDDSLFAKDWNFHTPQLFQYYYLSLNNKSDILSDVQVRKALRHLVDVDYYIENIEGGLGTRTIGHFNPAKAYYNNDIEPAKYDVEMAKALLNNASWKDNDGDGLLEKYINGRLQELELDIFITGSELSQKIALLFQQACAKAGIQINIITKASSLLRKENLYTFDYDIAALAITSDASPDDPYSRWHSDNAIPGKRNHAGYANPIADELIDKIRTTTDVEQRKKYYLELQEVMHKDVPVIFLYSPSLKVLTSSRLEATTTSKRPGYMVNSFKLKESI